MYKSKTCPHCGIIFTPETPRQTYCSQNCRFNHQKLKEKSKREEYKIPCEWCGTLFHPRTNTQKYCDGVHYRKCEICGEEFEIDLKKQDKPRTCSKECSYKLRFKDGNPFSRIECREKAEQTMLDKYGVRHAAQNNQFKEKMRETYREKTGYDHPVHNPEARSKMTSSARISRFESRIKQLLDEYGINYIHHYTITTDQASHEFDFYLPDNKLLIDADGLFYHGYLDDPNGKQVLDYYDEDRLAIIPEDCRLIVIVEGQEEKKIKEISELLREEYTLDEYDTEIFKWCRSIGFPYPQHTDDRMLKDWNRLCNYQSERYIPQCRLGNSIIQNFHHSIYSAHVGKYSSPLEGWEDDEKLKKVISNRLIYMNDVDPSKVLSGFNISKVCPKVSVFNPVLARYLTEKYLSKYKIVLDPFSGWSGRMLGVCSTGRIYIGFDLNQTAVKESNEIIDFLGLSAEVTCKDTLEQEGGGSCILTCPPYGAKEIYANEVMFHTCDEWIDIVLKNFDCDTYVFVVDKTEGYKDYIKEEISSTSHFNTTKEYVIVIQQ